MFRFFDSLLFAFERLWQHRILVLWALVGLVAATTLALSLPLYVDAVNTNLLAARLHQPPYSFRFRYLGSWSGNIKQSDVTSVTNAVDDGFVKKMALPVEQTVNFVRGGAWSIRLGTNKNLGAFSIGSLQGAENQMQITAGQWPPKPVKDGDPVPVLLPEGMLLKMGVNVGDDLTVTPNGGAKPFKMHVAALWKPVNANDPAWVFAPKYFDEVMLIQQDDLWKVMQGIDKPIEEGTWFLIFNGQNVKTSDVQGILARAIDGKRDVVSVFSGVRMESKDAQVIDDLTAFSAEVNVLTQQLIIMILPVAGLVLYFVSLVAGLLVSRQQQQDVTLRSRGMSRQAILNVHILMWLILAGTGLGIGLLAAPYVVRLVGQTTSFLRFDNLNAPLAVVFTPQAIAAGAVTSLLAASSGLFMAWRATRQTITSFSQQAARASRAWWQRLNLDILLLIPAGYVFYTLKSRGGLASQADNPFADPLVFVGPTLFSLGATLLFLRIWPFVLRIASGIVAQGRGISTLMALRELTRSIGRYRGALLMMCFTLSLTGFTASMASTLDRSLDDTINYRIGADAVLVTAADTNGSASTDASGNSIQTVTGFNTLPATDLLSIKGVTQVSRVGQYPAQIILAGQRPDGYVLGIDRAAMPAIAKFRLDYASEPIADLLNKLALNRTGVILNRAAADKYRLKVGQQITYQVSALSQWYQAKVTIVGLIDYFPTQDPNSGKFFMLTNIDPLWEIVGTQLPHDIWLSLALGADSAAVEKQVQELGFPVVEWKDPQVALYEAKIAPARRGVLGFLSVGFIASIVLTLVGNIIQSAASFRAQAVQLGALRAMGLGSLAVGAYLIMSQGLFVAGGILGGTSIGAMTTLLYLPLLDFGGGLPPYLVRVAWGDIFLVYAIFAGVLAFVTLFTTMILGRERLFTVVKLGESA